MVQAEVKRLEHEKENLVLLSAQKLDDPSGVANALNDLTQQIRRKEAELASLLNEFDAEKLAGVNPSWLRT